MYLGIFITEISISCFIENTNYNSDFVFQKRHFNADFYSQQQQSNLSCIYGSYITSKNRHLTAASNRPSYKPYNLQIL